MAPPPISDVGPGPIEPRDQPFKAAADRRGLAAGCFLRIARVGTIVALGFLTPSCDGEESGLYCKDGSFYLDGEAFESCAQCPSSDGCGFRSNVQQVCSYPNGVQQCRVTSGTVVASCNGQTATLKIENGRGVCAD